MNKYKSTRYEYIRIKSQFVAVILSSLDISADIVTQSFGNPFETFTIEIRKR